MSPLCPCISGFVRCRSSNVRCLTRIQWSSGGSFNSVPVSSFFRSPSHFRGSPFAAVVYPASTCGSLSVALGSGISLATAGVASTFEIQACDFLGNFKQDASLADEFVARVRYHDGISKDGHATVSSIGNGRYAKKNCAQ